MGRIKPCSLSRHSTLHAYVMPPSPSRQRTLMPPTEWSSAEFALAWHLARAGEDLLPVSPPGLALTETMEVLLC